MTGIDTDQLAGLARQGDADAYERLFERVGERLLTYVSLRLGPALRAQVEPLDVVQEVLLAAHRGFPGFEPRGAGSFRRWLFTIAEHRIRDAADAKAVRDREPSPPPEPAGPATLVGREESRARVVQALEQLPEAQREVILFRWFQGLTPEEMGSALGVSDRHARRLLAEAHTALAVALGGERPAEAEEPEHPDDASLGRTLAALEPDPPALPTPQRVGPYEVQEVLGQGGMSTVFRARQPGGGGDVAVKLLRCEGGAARARLGRELRALARLDHPGIVRVHRIGEHEGSPYLVMDLIPGESLHALITREGPLPLASAVRIAWRLAQALEHAHRENVLHRDVKPGNVMVRPDGSVVLTDFSLAKLLDTRTQHLTIRGQRLGTVGFWPPEQAAGRGDKVGPAADIYSLGATLFAMLTGQAPFERPSLPEQIVATLTEPAPAPSSLRPGVDPLLDQVCLHCLEKDPARRFPGAGDVALALSCWVPS